MSVYAWLFLIGLIYSGLIWFRWDMHNDIAYLQQKLTWQFGSHLWFTNHRGPRIKHSFSGPSCPGLCKMTESPPWPKLSEDIDPLAVRMYVAAGMGFVHFRPPMI